MVVVLLNIVGFVRSLPFVYVFFLYILDFFFRFKNYIIFFELFDVFFCLTSYNVEIY